MTTRRVSTEDLEFAETWLLTYDGAEDDEDDAVREIVKQTGTTPATARAALRRTVS